MSGVLRVINQYRALRACLSVRVGGGSPIHPCGLLIVPFLLQIDSFYPHLFRTVRRAHSSADVSNIMANIHR